MLASLKSFANQKNVSALVASANVSLRLKTDEQFSVAEIDNYAAISIV